MRRILPLIMLALASGPVHAEAPYTVAFYYRDFVRPIARKGVPIFFASCRDDHGGRDIAYFELGQRQGRYVEFDSRGFEENGAGVEPTVPVGLIDLNGGIASQQLYGEVADGLLASGFSLIQPDKMKAAFFATRPAKSCVRPHLFWPPTPPPKH